eukprot:TRINITY_DN49_c0_g1_i1.p1 TRINITY_DN49_c0_g1~~TRINITY_DN49_c0_g1_i1.p1  ORF type:complete len:178 (-),score=9.18 TRINITY_DN49_c0_g1_i1:16-549(-)
MFRVNCKLSMLRNICTRIYSAALVRTVHAVGRASSGSVFTVRSGNAKPFLSVAVRLLATDTHSEATVGSFNRLAADTVMYVQEQIEEVAEAFTGGADVDYADGVLTVSVNGVGTFVLNRQTPARQLWYSSPISGPSHYQLDSVKGWVDVRNQQSLWTVLSSEFSSALKTSLQFSQGK